MKLFCVCDVENIARKKLMAAEYLIKYSELS